jgi:2-polyprenyl-6-methoxyphenol hydroxylase-like FAD-dependent oxidoreductase
MTRPLLEAKVAECVCRRPNVRLRERTRVTGLCRDETGNVSGLRVEARKEPGRGQSIEADLVVDATGRESAIAQWLPAFGVKQPESESLGAPVAYATCLFAREGYPGHWGTLVVAAPPGKRGGIMVPVEGNRWMVTLGAVFDTPSPRNHAEFFEAARSLPIPDFVETIRGSHPVSDVTQYRFTGNRRRRYEGLDHFPDGLIVLGDAVCSSNPVYGLGLAVSIIEAEHLGQVLANAKRGGGIAPGFGLRWFRGIKPIIDRAWNLATIDDFRFPELADKCPIRLRPWKWYLSRVHLATHRSAQVTAQFYRVMNLADPLSSLLRPRLLSDVLFGGVFAKRRN